METSLEYVLMNTYKKEMISYLNSHPEDFEEAINLAVKDKQPYSWRAAWLLWSCMEKNDKRIEKHLERIIKALPSRKESQLRDLLLVLEKMELNEKFEGELFNISIKTWEKTSKIPSVRFSALKVILKIVRNHPELSKEVEFLTQSHYMDSFSESAKKSIYKMIKDLITN